MRRRRQAGRAGSRIPRARWVGWRPGLPRADRRCDRGSFTAELAAGLPALVLLLMAGLVAVTAVLTKAQCVDAARDGALAASRGESGSGAAARSAPPGADISVAISGDRVVASVRAPVRAVGALLPQITVGASAVAAIEPGSPEPVP